MENIVGYLLCMALPILILPIISMQIGEQLLGGTIRDKGTTRKACGFPYVQQANDLERKYF